MNSPASIQLNNNGTLQDLFTISDIVDFGSNSNGTYIKFSSGPIVMYGTYSLGSVDEPANIPISTPKLSHYVSNIVNFSLPTTAPYAGCISAGQDPGYGNTSDFWFIPGRTGSTAGGIRFFCSASYTITQIHIQWIYVGRWK